MDVINFSETPSAIHDCMAELRDVNIQNRKDVFRGNIELIGTLMGYEISKKLNYVEKQITTPLAKHNQACLEDNVVVITILRAGLPLHSGILKAFPHAENGFISAYRKHAEDGTFVIETGYVACPNLEGKALILNDPMLATGASFEVSLEALKDYGNPKSVHLAAVIASESGVEYIENKFADYTLWVAAIDPVLNDQKYIVPGLGDAGDLAFGEKLQE